MKTYIWEWVWMCSTAQAFPCPSSTCRIQRPPYRLPEVAELVTPNQCHPLWAWAIQLTGPIHPGSSHELTWVYLLRFRFLPQTRLENFPKCQTMRPNFQKCGNHPKPQANCYLTPPHPHLHTPTSEWVLPSGVHVRTIHTTFPHFLSLQGSAVVMVRAIGFQRTYFQGTEHSKSYSGYSSTFINFYLYCK